MDYWLVVKYSLLYILTWAWDLLFLITRVENGLTLLLRERQFWGLLPGLKHLRLVTSWTWHELLILQYLVVKCLLIFGEGLVLRMPGCSHEFHLRVYHSISSRPWWNIYPIIQDASLTLVPIEKDCLWWASLTALLLVKERLEVILVLTWSRYMVPLCSSLLAVSHVKIPEDLLLQLIW